MYFPVYKSHLLFITSFIHNSKILLEYNTTELEHGVVEALKDQGICRWNHALRSAQHHLKTHFGSFSQANRLSASAMLSTTLKHEKPKQSEESFRNVMYFSCWGPN
ncbi:hypothetical protein AAZX31_12G101200 [Glycine max]